MIKAIAFKTEHMKNIKKNLIDVQTFAFLDDIDTRAKVYANMGPAISIILNDVVLGIGGVVKFWHGVGEAWMMISPEGKSKWLSLYKHMDGFLLSCINDGFHRIQASVLVSDRKAHKTVMKLGFIPEGMMIHYGPKKENYIRYVRV